ncbi:MAG: DUF2892 domain-containing protein [Chloroflexota bacterium]
MELVRNLSSIDKNVRVVLSIALIALGLGLYFVGNAGLVALILPIAVGTILLTTVNINWCPIYAAVGISTYKQEA